MKSSKLVHALAACALGGGTAVGALTIGAGSAAAATSNYGPGAAYQVEISANTAQGSFWIWAALYPDGSVDYQEADCIHLGGGHLTDAAAHDTGSTATWNETGGTLTLSDINIIGDQAVANFAVPVPASTTGHSNGVTVTATSETGPFLPLNVSLSLPSQNEIAP